MLTHTGVLYLKLIQLSKCSGKEFGVGNEKKRLTSKVSCKNI